MNIEGDKQLRPTPSATWPVAVAIWDGDDCLVAFNDRFTDIHAALASVLVPGISYEEFLRAALAAGLRPTAGADGDDAAVARGLAHWRRSEGRDDYVDADGRWRRADHRRVPEGSVVVIHDITDLKNAEAEARHGQQRAESLLAIAGAIFVSLDRDLQVTMINRRGLEAVGRPEHEVVGWDWVEMALAEDERGAARIYMNGLLTGYIDPTARHEVEIDMGADAAERRIIAFEYAVLVDAAGRPDGLLCTGIDLTEYRLVEEQNQFLMSHDELTGLANRTLFMDRLSLAIAGARRNRNSVAVLFVDLDGFKPVNDTYGHEAGDEVLRQVGIRLSEAIRATDTLARFGGDEFTVVLTDVARRDDAARVAAEALAVLGRPFKIKGAAVTIGASIGIAIFPDDAADAEALVRGADKAMYRVKESGRNNYRFVAADV